MKRDIVNNGRTYELKTDRGTYEEVPSLKTESTSDCIGIPMLIQSPINNTYLL